MGKWDEMRRATPRRKETEGGQIFVPASQGFHVPGDGDLGEGGYIPREVTVKTPVTKDPSFVVLKRTPAPAAPAPAAPAPAEVEPMTILRRTPAPAEEEPDLFDEWLRKLDAEAAEVAKKKAAVEAAKKAAEEEAAKKAAEEEAARKKAEEEAAKKAAEEEAKKKAEEAAKKKAEEEAKKKAEEEAAKKKAEEEAKKKAEEEAKVIFPRLGYIFTTEEGDLLVFLDIEKAKKFSKENEGVLPQISPVLVNKKTSQVLRILSYEEILAMFDE